VPPLEAMALGIPVVASDIPALRETTGDGGAILVAPGDIDAIADALRRAVCDESVRVGAERDGPAHARRYRWSTTAARVRDALELAAG
jgi:glycosyltransferase involved in cell wall biosynthesis